MTTYYPLGEVFVLWVNIRMCCLYCFQVLSSSPIFQVMWLVYLEQVMIYNGDYDVITSTYGIEESLMTLPWEHQAEYNASSRVLWKGDPVKFHYSAFKDPNGYQVRGYYTKVKDFCRVILHRAGHQATAEQGDSTLKMMEDFVKYGCVQQDNWWVFGRWSQM